MDMFKVERSQLLSLTLFQSVGSHRLQDHFKRFLTFPIHGNLTLKYSQHHSAFTVGGHKIRNSVQWGIRRKRKYGEVLMLLAGCFGIYSALQLQENVVELLGEQTV